MTDAPLTPAALANALKTRLLNDGFAKVGIARAQRLEPEGARLREWLADGRHGQMQWMANTVDVREDPRHRGMVEGAVSVVIGAFPYARDAARVGPAPGRVARYARGRDYHNVLSRKLRRAVKWLRELGHEARFSVDSRPVLERAWAQRAGVGFVGKNCCLIVPGLGSHVFLGALVTTAELPVDEPMKPRCGACRLCLDACPTKAFVGERQLDARRCISYLTIEHEGSIDNDLASQMGDWVFGCDVCQDVCPYNRTSLPAASATAAFAPHERFASTSCEDLLRMDDETFRDWSEGSPLRRAGPCTTGTQCAAGAQQCRDR